MELATIVLEGIKLLSAQASQQLLSNSTNRQNLLCSDVKGVSIVSAVLMMTPGFQNFLAFILSALVRGPSSTTDRHELLFSDEKG